MHFYTHAQFYFSSFSSCGMTLLVSKSKVTIHLVSAIFLPMQFNVTSLCICQGNTRKVRNKGNELDRTMVKSSIRQLNPAIHVTDCRA